MFNAEIINRIKERLVGESQTVAVAESVTAGLLQAAMASAVEAGKMFQGGITAYNIGQKCRHLNINPIHALDCNCVSERMAEDMALSVCQMFTSHWGIGVTGYATPVPESDNKIFAYFSIAFKGKTVLTQKLDAHGELAMDAQIEYVDAILAKFLESLKLIPESRTHNNRHAQE